MIAQSVMAAIGDEICLGLAGEKNTLDDVRRMFTTLAGRDDSQYSYLNTLAAVTDEGETVGVCVGYNGALLHELRKAFIEEAKKELGLEFDEMEDETDPSEFYLDTLAVNPEYRGQGIAKKLLRASIDRAAEIGKPAGLLVDKTNANARRLYESIGFRQVGERPFCFVLMDHLQFPAGR